MLVATPGRLLDHIEDKNVHVQPGSILVLDEADRMLDIGFLPDLQRILALPARSSGRTCCSRPRSRPRSAAWPRATCRIPAEVEVARAQRDRRPTSTHVLQPVARREEARRCSRYLIQTRGLPQVLVFVGTSSARPPGALAASATASSADALHGDKSQDERLKALEAFKAGKIDVLVATDVAARGLDIEDLPQVFNFDVPFNAEDYVHRIGRTGRAGLPGEAISLVAPQDMEAIGGDRAADQEAHRARAGPGIPAERRHRRGADGRRAERAQEETSRATREGPVSPPSAGMSRAKKAAADPIFSKPYEPTLRQRPRRRNRPSRSKRASASSRRSRRCSAD